MLRLKVMSCCLEDNAARHVRSGPSSNATGAPGLAGAFFRVAATILILLSH
jgi:hypothetical protein